VQQLTVSGEPIYGPRDVVDLAEMRRLGSPFWLAGGYGTPEQLAAALAAGAAGIQVGTAFAFSAESALREEVKQWVISRSQADQCHVRTDPRASPTGFPFKVVSWEGSLSEAAVYEQRTRLCDLGYLRRAYRRTDGTLGYRCPAEPVEDYLAKGGTLEETVGRKCLCNALFAVIGLGQHDAQGTAEPPVITAGDDAAEVARYLPAGQTAYSAQDVLEYLLGSPQPAWSDESMAAAPATVP
jgi:NAD(P)H-dependent flavin oxidoreductase YrpB (nitropropane dioxygenase family)